MPPNQNFIAFALVTMKFGAVVELDVLHTVATKVFGTLSLLRNNDVITRIYDTHRPKLQIPVASEPFA